MKHLLTILAILLIPGFIFAISVPWEKDGNLQHPLYPNDAVVVGDTATSSDGIFEVNGDSTFEGNVDLSGNNINDVENITFQNGVTGGHIQTGTSNADFFEIEAYDTNASAYREMFTITAGNQPTIIFNTDRTTSDLTIRSDTASNDLTFDGATGRLGIGTTSPATTLDVDGVITATGGDSDDWNTAFGWGDHSAAGYLDGVTATGLEVSGTDVALSTGYEIPLSASTTNWQNFYDTPSTRITAGTGLSWSTNTLNVDDVETLSTSLTTGSVVFSDGTNLSQDNANFFWDDSNKRLGIGTDSPLSGLHIVGSSDDEKLIVQGSSTQTANFQEWQSSDGTVYSSLGFYTPSIGDGNPVSVLKFNNPSLSGNNLSGGIDFQFGGTTYARIDSQIGGGGNIRFYTTPSGGSLTNVYTIETDGTINHSVNTESVTTTPHSITNNTQTNDITDVLSLRSGQTQINNVPGLVFSPISSSGGFAEDRRAAGIYAKKDANTNSDFKVGLSFYTFEGSTGSGGAASIPGVYSSKMTLDSSGNLGIGTTTPSQRLTIVGSLGVTGTTTLNGVTYDWPGADGSNGQVLSTDGSGTLTWEDVSGGGGDPDQNLFETFVGDTGSTTANTTTDTLTVSGGTNVSTSISGDTLTINATDTNLSNEEVQDITGAMFSGNTETLITATYQDGDGTIDLVVDNDLSNYDNTTSGFFDASSDVSHDSTTGFVANEHIDHSGVSITGGTGLSGGGDITASRSLDLDINSLTDRTAFASGDKLAIYEDGVGIRKIDYDDLPGAGGGITSLNGLTASTQTFATSTASGTFDISSTSSTHTFTIPSNVGFFTNDSGYLTSVDISDDTNLTVGATGIELSGDDIALTTGYEIPLSASTTEWEAFKDTPSTEITAGTGLSWSGNTINAEVETSDLHDAVTLSGTPDYITLSGQDIVRGTIDFGDLTASDIIIESEGIAANDNDTTIPTSAAVKDYADTNDSDTTYTAGGTLLDLSGTTFSLNEGTLTNGNFCTYNSTGTQLECTTSGSLDDDDLSDNTLNDLSQTSLADPAADQLVFWDDSDTAFEFISTLTGLSISGNTLSVDTVDFSDGTNATDGDGITFSGDAITADLGTSIDSSEIEDSSIVNADINGSAAIAYSKLNLTDSILEADLDATNAPSDDQILSFDNGSGGFTWVDDATGGGGAGDDTIFATSTLGGIETIYAQEFESDFILGSDATSTAGFWFDNSATTTHIGSGGTGDSVIEFAIDSVSKWMVGADDDDSDNFVISSGDTLGTNNMLEINSNRVVTTHEERVMSVTVASTSEEWFNGGSLPAGSDKDGYTLTEYRCWVEGGTSVVLNLSDGTNSTESITCGTSVTSDTDVATNDTFTADEKIYLDFGSITGDVDYIHFEAYADVIR